MPTLLVVDDEPNVLYSLQAALESDELQVVTAATAGEGLERLRLDRPDAIILDVRLPDMSGLEAFKQIHAVDPRLPVILITAYSTTETAIEAMRTGAFDYLLKPVDLRQLRELVRKALEISRLSRVPAVIEEPEEDPAAVDRIVGHSLPMQAVYKAIGRFARQDVTVLILGESGTGKELTARAVYHYSDRREKPFLAINCAAIPETLLESELFGHARGAFTGAESRRAGKFEQAHGGTIFLDEIGDMTPATQAKILRVLQEQCFEPLGSTETVRTDVRLIAATNQDLPTLIAEGRFRQDLYYRLNVCTLTLPPLRQRVEDLPLLVDHFVRLYQRQLRRRIRMITPEAQAMIERYPWPGNVRELQSALKYALIHTNGEVLTADCLPEFVRAAVSGAPDPLVFSRGGNQAARYAGEGTPVDYGALLSSTVSTLVLREIAPQVGHYIQTLLDQGAQDLHRRVHSEIDRILLEAVLRHVGGHQQEAADVLGISRTTLRARLRTLGLGAEGLAESDSDPLPSESGEP